MNSNLVALTATFFITTHAMAQSNLLDQSSSSFLSSPQDRSAQSAATSSYINSNMNAFQGRTTVVDQGGGAFTIQSGNGDLYLGVTSGGSTQIVGVKGPTMSCVTSAGSTNCIQY